MPTQPASSPDVRAACAALGIALAALVIGCGTGAADPGDGSAPPAATLPAARQIVIDGAAWHVLTAGADGMRGRSDFGGADGMLFDLGRDIAPGAVAFVMDDVPVALDIAWFAADGTLVGRARMKPCVTEPCPRYEAPAPFRYAIEAPPGAFDEVRPAAALDLEP